MLVHLLWYLHALGLRHPSRSASSAVAQRGALLGEGEDADLPVDQYATAGVEPQSSYCCKGYHLRNV